MSVRYSLVQAGCGSIQFRQQRVLLRQNARRLLMLQKGGTEQMVGAHTDDIRQRQLQLVRIEEGGLPAAATTSNPVSDRHMIKHGVTVIGCAAGYW